MPFARAGSLFAVLAMSCGGGESTPQTPGGAAGAAGGAGDATPGRGGAGGGTQAGGSGGSAGGGSIGGSAGASIGGVQGGASGSAAGGPGGGSSSADARPALDAAADLAGADRAPSTPLPPRPDAGPGRLVERVVKPEVADPAADMLLVDQLAIVDQRYGPAGRLVLYLVGAGGTPSGGRGMMRELATFGFHAIAPHYANAYGIDVCSPAKDPDEDCHRKVRLEAYEGVDHSPHIQITRPNSAEERTIRMLAYLHKMFPAEGWGAYLDGDKLNYGAIVVAGHSHGASTAGLVGKVRPCERVVMLSGPFDNRSNRPAAWTMLAPATPADRFYGFSHTMESQHAGHLRDWVAMGLDKHSALVDVATATPPYPATRRFVTSFMAADSDAAHGSTAATGASPRLPDGTFRYAPAWRTMFGR
jgi:hypothetical protein